MSEPTDQLAEADKRPWEEPGSCRMDCAPHRGSLLRLLSDVSLWAGVLSFCVPLAGPVAVLLSTTVYVLARRDLGKMNAGLMDPDGRRRTECAISECRTGILCAVLGCGLWTLVIALRLNRGHCIARRGRALMKKPILWAASPLALALAAVLLVPASRWRVVGWARGEAFYRGRPTTYWSAGPESRARPFVSATSVRCLRLSGRLADKKAEGTVP